MSRNMNYASNVRTTGQVELPKWRARVLFVLLMLVLFLLLVRAVYLQVVHTGFLQQEGDQVRCLVATRRHAGVQ